MTMCIASSCKVPCGSPDSRRSILPPGGSGVSRVIPAAASATVFTQPSCPSRLSKKAGRSGTTASRSARLGVPPAKESIDHPVPTIQSSSGCSAE